MPHVSQLKEMRPARDLMVGRLKGDLTGRLPRAPRSEEEEERMVKG